MAAYGRLRADTTLSLEAGGGLGLSGSDLAPALSTAARIRCLDMTGVFVSYDAVFTSTRSDALSVGLDVRPLMFARIFYNWEIGPRWLDLHGGLPSGSNWDSGFGISATLGMLARVWVSFWAAGLNCRSFGVTAPRSTRAWVCAGFTPMDGTQKERKRRTWCCSPWASSAAPW